MWMTSVGTYLQQLPLKAIYMYMYGLKSQTTAAVRSPIVGHLATTAKKNLIRLDFAASTQKSNSTLYMPPIALFSSAIVHYIEIHPHPSVVVGCYQHSAHFTTT